jgi:hypothetical protein
VLSGEDERAIDRAASSDEIRERMRVTEEAKKEGGWTNLVPIRCPQCGDIAQWPGHWSRPICALCDVQIDKRVRMQWARAATQPESLDTAPRPEIPAGLRPYEERALRAMRSAVARAVEEERTLVWRWLRKQGRGTAELADGRALAEAVKRGDHRQKTPD